MKYLILLALPIIGCTAPRIPTAIQNPDRPVIIFVPGFYGTALAEVKTGKRRFLTASEALFGTTPVGINDPGYALPGGVDLRIDGILSEIRIVPGIYSLDIYGSAYKFLKKEFSAQNEVIVYPYDWRQDVHHAVEGLGTLIDDLKKAGVKKIALVGHSMGGLVTSYYLRYGVQNYESAVETWAGAENIDTVVLAGTPYRGATISFLNLQNGTALGTAKAPLSSLSLGTMPAMYELMPAPETDFLFAAKEMSPGATIYDVQNWKKNNWGFFQDKTASPTVREYRQQFLQRTLVRANQFKMLMTRKSTAGVLSARKKMLYFSGKNFATPGRAVWSQSSFSESGKWTAKSEEGDSSVSFRSAVLPTAISDHYEVENVSSDARHDQMYADNKLQERTIKFLHERGF